MQCGLFTYADHSCTHLLALLLTCLLGSSLLLGPLSCQGQPALLPAAALKPLVQRPALLACQPALAPLQLQLQQLLAALEQLKPECRKSLLPCDLALLSRLALPGQPDHTITNFSCGCHASLDAVTAMRTASHQAHVTACCSFVVVHGRAGGHRSSSAAGCAPAWQANAKA